MQAYNVNYRIVSYSINKKDWVNIMKEKLMRFMYGRYGVDTFGKFLLWSGVILMLITSIFHFRIFYVIGWAFVIYSYYRMFSRQTYKRALENQKFLQHTSKIRGFFAKQKYMAAQRKTHHIYKCPNCKQKIRVPKEKVKLRSAVQNARLLLSKQANDQENNQLCRILTQYSAFHGMLPTRRSRKPTAN